MGKVLTSGAEQGDIQGGLIQKQDQKCRDRGEKPGGDAVLGLERESVLALDCGFLSWNGAVGSFQKIMYDVCPLITGEPNKTSCKGRFDLFPYRVIGKETQ